MRNSNVQICTPCDKPAGLATVKSGRERTQYLGYMKYLPKTTIDFEKFTSDSYNSNILVRLPDITMTEDNNETEWDVPCSDGESEGNEIPMPVVKLYKRIEEQGVLELQVKEYRSSKLSKLKAESSSNMSKESSNNECISKSPVENQLETEPEAEAEAEETTR